MSDQQPPESAPPARPGRGRWIRVASAVVPGLLIALVMLSDSVALWWVRQKTAKTTNLPSFLQEALAWWPNTEEGDVHVVLWVVAGLVALALVRRRWRSLFCSTKSITWQVVVPNTSDRSRELIVGSGRATGR